jgi:hypothetical protein
MLATVLGAILARTAALLAFFGRFLLATTLGTTATAGGCGCGWGWGFGCGCGCVIDYAAENAGYHAGARDFG